MVLNNQEINEGDYVVGRWVDQCTGKTYAHEGTVRRYPAGLFVQYEDEGITPLADFYRFDEIRKQPINRASGYYWVKNYGEWCIAWYDEKSKEWEMDGKTYFADSEFDQIDNTLIIPPDRL